MATQIENEAENFDFEQGDTVLVRVRQHGDSGRIQAKFVAECTGFRSNRPVGSAQAQFDPPWDQIGTVDLRYYEAEYEVVEDGQDHV